MTCRKNPKLQHVPKVFPLGGTTSYPTTKCNASKGKCVGTGCNFGFFFLRKRCPGESFIDEGLKLGIKVGSLSNLHLGLRFLINKFLTHV